MPSGADFSGRVDADWLDQYREETIEPELPIVDTIGFEGPGHYLGGGTKPGAVLLGDVTEYGRNAQLAADMDVAKFAPHVTQ